MINLGQELRDRITGFTGIATARVEYLNGCVQYALRSKISKKMRDEGKFPEAYYFDEAQLEMIGKGLLIETKKTGGEYSEKPPSIYKGV